LERVDDVYCVLLAEVVGSEGGGDLRGDDAVPGVDIPPDIAPDFMFTPSNKFNNPLIAGALDAVPPAVGT